jgi:hypothetical protein
MKLERDNLKEIKFPAFAVPEQGALRPVLNRWAPFP